jgi:tetratricopeptide (TPR) repeat protein
VVSHRPLLGLVLLSLAASGCAAIRPVTSATPGAEVSPAPSALSASVPTADQLAAPHRARAVQLEEQGRLRPAVEAWLTALALAPDHQPSRQALKRLRARIEREIDEHLRDGWRALAADQSVEARRHFMAALALDPDAHAAQDALRALPAASAGSPAVEAKVTPVTVRTVVAAPHPPARPSEGEGAEKPEVLYAVARGHLAARREDEACRILARLARVSPGYKDSAVLLSDLSPRVVQRRYHEGIRLFREEKLEAAIEQWRFVLDIEPGHANARRSIEQAEKMLRTLAAQPTR